MYSFRIFCVLVWFLFLSCAEKEQKEIVIETPVEKYEIPVFHKSHEPKKQDAPFSDAVQVGNTFYLSGQIGMNHSLRELVEGGIEAETRQTLENIRAVLSIHGLHFSDVVKVTVILETMDDFSIMNEIYQNYFPQKPARTTFAAKTLARGAKIEIEVIAVKTVDSHLIHG